jgi:hypothetical protein
MKKEKPTIEAIYQKEAYSNKICELVKTLVSTYYELPISAFNSKSRQRQVIKMKQASVYFIRKLLPKTTLIYIGQQMQYDHATVIHCLKCISNLLETDKETRMDIQALSKNIELQTDFVSPDGNINSDYHYINLDVCDSFKFKDGRGLVLSNWNDLEIKEFEMFMEQFYEQNPERHAHANTGLFIIKKKILKESENEDIVNFIEKSKEKTLLDVIDTTDEPNILNEIVDKKIKKTTKK